MNKLSDGEWKLMELLWEESPVNSTRLVERCRERLTWSKSTTYTVLRRLCRKGAAVNEGAVVSPKLGREEPCGPRGRSWRSRRGAVPLPQRLFQRRRLTPEEAEELKELSTGTPGRVRGMMDYVFISCCHLETGGSLWG